jgi:excisionase family DNA binding protein
VSTLPTQILLVSQYDAARLLGVQGTTISRMCGRGDLARVRIGRRTRITMDSLKAFIALQVELRRRPAAGLTSSQRRPAGRMWRW